MSIDRTPDITLNPAWSEEELTPKVDRFNPLPTPTTLRQGALFGIPMQSAFTNDSVTDEQLQRYINEAISEVEHLLDLYITPVKFKEKHDYLRHNFTWNYNYLKLNHPNVYSILSVQLSFTNDIENTPFVDFPLEHVHLMPQEGVIQLVPAFGTSLSGFLLSAFSGTQFHALRAIGITNFPGGIRITYEAGFPDGQCPAVLTALIETIAGIKTLSMLGPILFPQNSTSIGIDGTSQSVSTLGPAFFQNRLADLEKQRATQTEAAKTYYQRSFLVDWF